MPTLLYVADPMCSWCYAFRPELERITARSALPLRIVLGGLFVGPQAIPLDDGFRAYLRETWNRVSAYSGQPISFDLLDRDGWTYDTELACRAVVAARQTDETLAHPLFDRLQRAFYIEGADLTDRAAYPPLAADVGLDGDELGLALERLDVIAATRDDFAAAAGMGVRGFPTLMLDTGDERITVSAGYRQADQVLRSIEVMIG